MKHAIRMRIKGVFRTFLPSMSFKMLRKRLETCWNRLPSAHDSTNPMVRENLACVNARATAEAPPGA